MLESITKSITNEIVQSLPEYQDKAERIEYGLYMALSDTPKVLALILISLPLNLLMHVLVAIVTFGMLRVFLGGIHSKTQIQCIITYPIFIYGSIYLSIMFNIPHINLVGFTIAIMLAFIYAPADLPCKPVRSKYHRKKLRILGLTSLLILFAISFFVPSEFSNLICLNSLIVSLMLTPIVYKITGNTLSNQGGGNHEDKTA